MSLSPQALLWGKSLMLFTVCAWVNYAHKDVYNNIYSNVLAISVNNNIFGKWKINDKLPSGACGSSGYQAETSMLLFLYFLFPFYSQTGETALHLASKRGHVKVIHQLVEAHADLNILDKVWAAFFGLNVNIIMVYGLVLCKPFIYLFHSVGDLPCTGLQAEVMQLLWQYY